MTMENGTVGAAVTDAPQGTPETAAIPPAPPGTEKPAAEAAPETKTDDRISSKAFAALSKKERELQLQKKQLDPELKELAEFKKLKALAKENPLEFIEKSGLSYEELTEFLLKGDKKPPTELELLKKRVEEQEEKLSAKDREREEVEKQKATSDYKSSQKEFIMGKKDKYELITAFDEWDLVFQTAQEFFQKHNEMPTHEQVADMVEAHLEKVTNPLLDKVLQTKKFGHFAKPKENALAPETQSTQSLPGTTPTLTNKMSQTVANPEADANLTSEQRWKKALSLLQ